jgi:hypothetical protein
MTNTNGLCAIYDLTTSPNSFDYVKFLIVAELKRRELGCDHIRVLIAPDIGKTDWLNKFSDDEFSWRLRNIIQPLNSLMPSINGMTTCDSREEFEKIAERENGKIFPENYSPVDPPLWSDWETVVLASVQGKPVPGLKAPGHALNYVQKWLAENCGNRKVVSITLRQTTYETERNSNLENWIRFADTLPPDEYAVIFLRDTGRIFEPVCSELEGRQIFDFGTIHLELRAALYELAFINMFVGNGCGEVGVFLPNTRYVHFLNVPDPDSPTGIIQDRIENGWAARDRLPFSRDGQYFVFGTDTYENICYYFELAIQPEDPPLSDVFEPSKLDIEEIILLLFAASRHQELQEVTAKLGIENVPIWLDQRYADKDLPPLSPKTGAVVCLNMASALSQIGEQVQGLSWLIRELDYREDEQKSDSELLGVKIDLANKAINFGDLSTAVTLLERVWDAGVRAPRIADLLVLLYEQTGESGKMKLIQAQLAGGVTDSC